MFWKKKTESAKPPPALRVVVGDGPVPALLDPRQSSAPGRDTPSRRPEVRSSRRPLSLDQELERALDTVAGMLRAVGRLAFELPDEDARAVGAACEGWASHLLLRTLPPGQEQPAEDAGLGPPVRDWRGVGAYFGGLRKREHVHLTKALADLRQVVWAFVHGLNQALVSDGKVDASLKTQLGRLTHAAKSSSTEDLKREVLSVVDVIGEVFEKRQKEQLQHAAELGARMAALGQALEEARREVALDPLTRLYNRKTFDEELSRAADMGTILRASACLVLVDLDHFKDVNDTHGHQAGDEVIRQTTGCLARTFRHRDDVVARYGGEEFAVILRDTQMKDATMLSERLLGAVRAMRVPVGATTVEITVSAGVAELRFGETDAEWLARADQALYEAKHQGRDRWIAS
jgi:diguanylate cyclase (GGDEF)-like protein